jgi:ArsR family transcriptional regulator
VTDGDIRFTLFAEIFAALAHPKRLEIVHILGHGEHTAGELVEKTGLSKANVSQHVGILKARGLIHCEKRGTFCHYRLTDPGVLDTCEQIRHLILDRMELSSRHRAELARAKAPVRGKSHP